MASCCMLNQAAYQDAWYYREKEMNDSQLDFEASRLCIRGPTFRHFHFIIPPQYPPHPSSSPHKLTNNRCGNGRAM